MKTIYNRYLWLTAIAIATLGLQSCDDYLDVTPPSEIAPELYFTSADQLAAYTINYYCNYSNWDSGQGGQFPSHADYTSFIHDDMGSDNEASSSCGDQFYEGADYKVQATGGDWYFNRINDINFFIRSVRPKVEAGEVSGNPVAVKHYFGEAYMLRAMEYFHRLRRIGDFPIITSDLPDDRDVLVEVSKRQPRNKVARFILADLDSALTLLSDGSATGGRARITRDAALLFKARVALYEATWEKYFAGTPFVPDAAAGWPGKDKSYNAGFAYDNESEVRFFLDQALAAAKEIADAHPLTQNSKNFIGADVSVGANPYYDMFASTDPSAYDEVLMYRVYNQDKGVAHSLNQYMRQGQPRGYTQEFANAFLMENGLPIYADGSGYAGDDWVADTKKNRDWRWQLFMKAPGEYVYADADDRMGGGKNFDVPVVWSGSVKFCTSTGYKKGKYMTKLTKYTSTGTDETASVVFRAAEAYLIYLEAAWERYGDNLDADAWKYWQALRLRAGVDTDIRKTINATDFDKEEFYSHDLALYSAGRRIESKVLYNIRRERRCELMSEGFRLDDLYRWRALDQIIGGRYYVHGAKIFGPMLGGFAKNRLKYDQTDSSKNNVSSPQDTDGGLNGDANYLSMFRVSKDNKFYDKGMSWHMAHYLSPIAVSHFLESSANGNDIGSSPIYQNPYWGTTSNTPAQK